MPQSRALSIQSNQTKEPAQYISNFRFDNSFFVFVHQLKLAAVALSLEENTHNATGPSLRDHAAVFQPSSNCND